MTLLRKPWHETSIQVRLEVVFVRLPCTNWSCGTAVALKAKQFPNQETRTNNGKVNRNWEIKISPRNRYAKPWSSNVYN
jgi:hypothetical protein